ncbi:MAG: NUDIX hydrolase [Planctomycetota bacterium]
MIQQAAVIPYRIEDGEMIIHAVTSRAGQWSVPKGHIEPGETDAQTAVREAWEEAGLTGELDDVPVGEFTYEKLGNVYRVVVFRMRVTGTASDWPEKNERRSALMTPIELADCVWHPQLAEIIRGASGWFAK